MSLITFLEKVQKNEPINFNETIKVIADNYNYKPTRFNNGLNKDKLINAKGSNEGSCKIFSFAKINQLTETQTLHLFGDFYRKEVLENPIGTSHQNIRHFIKYGWAGIYFETLALSEK